MKMKEKKEEGEEEKEEGNTFLTRILGIIITLVSIFGRNLNQNIIKKRVF